MEHLVLHLTPLGKSSASTLLEVQVLLLFLLMHHQLFHLILGRSVPVVWALLSNKTKKLYREGVFEVLKNLMTDRTGGEAIEDKTFVADFERGITGAAKEVFEDCQIYGCLFHFRQVLKNSEGLYFKI